MSTKKVLGPIALAALFALAAPPRVLASDPQEAARILVRAILRDPPAGVAQVASARPPGKGTAITDDRSRILVNKVQSGGRWSVTMDTERLDILGNVTGDDNAVTFLYCKMTGADGTDIYRSSFFLACYSAVIGTTIWDLLGSYTIPVAFFLP